MEKLQNLKESSKGSNEKLKNF